jgi:hypothetical protein
MWIEPALALPARQHRLVASMLPNPPDRGKLGYKHHLLVDQPIRCVAVSSEMF